MRAVIGEAVAPAGFKIVAELPAIEEEADLKEQPDWQDRAGRLADREGDGLVLYMGTIHSRKLSKNDLKQTPTANFVVKYTNNKYTNKKLNGTVACELSTRKHGATEWWVLLRCCCRRRRRR